VTEVMKKGFLSTITPEWKSSTLTNKLVLMGHSFGGITVYGAAENCKAAVAIVGIDPWFWPHHEDKIKASEN
jgi:alpha-beta hydrolase superfamily lysophospholipase